MKEKRSGPTHPRIPASASPPHLRSCSYSQLTLLRFSIFRRRQIKLHLCIRPVTFLTPQIPDSEDGIDVHLCMPRIRMRQVLLLHLLLPSSLFRCLRPPLPPHAEARQVTISPAPTYRHIVVSYDSRYYDEKTSFCNSSFPETVGWYLPSGEMAGFKLTEKSVSKEL